MFVQGYCKNIIKKKNINININTKLRVKIKKYIILFYTVT